jgi:hypothetical protein
VTPGLIGVLCDRAAALQRYPRCGDAILTSLRHLCHLRDREPAYRDSMVDLIVGKPAKLQAGDGAVTAKELSDWVKAFRHNGKVLPMQSSTR